jgi:BirA family biotin operon repressor/biotin-[acetyl-CoA-carboxylase] ligase
VNIDRNQLTATLLTELRLALRQFEIDGLAPFISRWRNLDNFIDRPVKLLIGEQEIHGIERGIDQQGALLLEQDGVIKPYIGGEISLRGR